MLKVDVAALKKRLEENKKKAEERGSSSPNSSLFFAPTAAGKHLLRAVPYIHNAEPHADPFLELGLHYIFGLGWIYCPQINKNEQCHLCDFTWEQMKANKGNKEAVSQWGKNLPSVQVFIPVKVRAPGADEEDLKFFKVKSYRDKQSDNHAKLYTFFDDEPNWMDPMEGFDLEVTYEEMSEDQKKRFRSKTGIMLKEFGLARKSSKFGTAKEYEEFLKRIPNLIEDSFPTKTTEDTLKLLERWQEKQKRSEVTNDVGTSTVDSSIDDSASEDNNDVVEADDVSAKLKALGLE